MAPGHCRGRPVNDWTAARPEPFSLAYGQQCAEELAKKVARCKLNPAAFKSECKDFARVAVEIYRKERSAQ